MRTRFSCLLQLFKPTVLITTVCLANALTAQNPPAAGSSQQQEPAASPTATTAAAPVGETAAAAPASPASQESTPPADKQAASDQSALAAASAQTDAEVEGLLFFASDDSSLPSAASPEAEADEKELTAAFLSDIRGRLSKTHPAKTHQLLGRHTQKVFKEYESWVVPSKELCLKLDSRGPAPAGQAGVQLSLQLWQDKKVLVKSDVLLAPDKPIIIGGPKWRNGRLLFVLSQRKDK